MNKRTRTQFFLGILLILVAGWLLLDQIRPEWTSSIKLTFSWPVWVILAGVALFLIGLVTGAPGIAIPATIVAGIGGILYYQNTTDDWASWAYMWTLLPGLAGIGKLLSGLVGGTFRQEAREAINSIFISIILFAIFASLFGGLKLLGPYKDYVLIGLLFFFGSWLIVRGLLRK
ncbi:MAG: hypothetical protein N2049_03515 [Anaerolineales bacterium]|nr:hypothetical protein [Anaerolineales bacterium]